MIKIYLDHAATTPVDRDALTAAMPYFGTDFYNPSSLHAAGQKAARAVEAARLACAEAINGKPEGIHFTSGGTEAINWALKCAPTADRTHIVVSAIEHDAVLACADKLRAEYDVDIAEPNADGIITPDALRAVIRDDTAIVCVMTVNNIVGTIQPIKEPTDVAHEKGALMFTDAVQAVNSCDIDVADTGVDMLCVSAHKFYGMKGAGFLYVDPRIKISPFMDGGGQERGMRSGTLNVPAIVAMAKAITAAKADRKANAEHIAQVSLEFLSALKFGAPVAMNSPKIDDIVSVVFDGVNGGRLAVALSMSGVYCSVGSACSAGSATPPATLTAMGVKNADCALRFSFGKKTTVAQAVAAAQTINVVVSRLVKSTEAKDVSA